MAKDIRSGWDCIFHPGRRPKAVSIWSRDEIVSNVLRILATQLQADHIPVVERRAEAVHYFPNTTTEIQTNGSQQSVWNMQ